MSRGSEDYGGGGPEAEESGDSFAEVLNSFTFDSGRKRRRRKEQVEELPEPEPAPELDEQRQHAEPEPEPIEAQAPSASSIRSYTWTGGRTKSNHQLELETLVSSSEAYRSGTPVRWEHQSIAELCRQPRSVAEVGALLQVPIGVVKVLVADMADLGLITVHQTVTESGSAPHLMLMERVLSGLRRL